MASSLPGVIPVILVVGVMMLSAESMGRSAMILVGCMGVTGLLAYVAVVEAPRREGEPRQSILQRFLQGPPASREEDSLSTESVKELVDRFRLEMTEVRDSIQLLTEIYRRIRGSSADAQAAAKSAFDLGLFESSLLFLQTLEPDDKRIPLAADVVNELLSKEAIRSAIVSEEEHLKTILDGLLVAVQDLATPPSVDGKKKQAAEKLDEDDESSLLPPEKKIPNPVFPIYGYKLLMAIGLLCGDNRDAQTMAGDRGALKLIVGSFQTYGAISADVAKWCCWTSIHLTYDHPPNKREFYQRGGLVQLVDALKIHAKSTAVYEQALGLMINILVHDGQTKMNQSQARQAVLAANVFEVLQRAQKEFKSNEAIQAMINQVLQILIQDWS